MSGSIGDAQLISSNRFLVHAHDITGWQFHREFEICYTHSHAVFMANNQVYTMEAGDLLFIPPLTLHNLALNKEESIDVTSFKIKASTMEIFSPFLPALFFNGETYGILKLEAQEIEEFEKLVWALELSLQRKDEIGDTVKRISLANMLIFLYDLVKEGGGKSQTASIVHHRQFSQKLKEAQTFIDEHFREPISLDDIAQNCFINKSYLCRLFKKELGFGVSEYITFCRINLATDLLTTGLSVNECAMQCGFGSATYFSKIFKEAVGVNPSSYMTAIR